MKKQPTPLHAINMLVLGLAIPLMLACDALNALSDQFFEDDPCFRDGNSLKVTGGFLPAPDNPWVNTTNTILLQYNTNCTDVYGYSDLVQELASDDHTEIGTSRISFKGSYDHQTGKFVGTVYVDYDLICQGACEGYEPYSFNYPANWNGLRDAASGNVNGWIDGFGDFRLDVSTVIDGKSYREVPGLEIWP